MPWRNKMNKKTPLYTIAWTQSYNHWESPKVKLEEEIADLTQAREVLARIMSK